MSWHSKNCSTDGVQRIPADCMAWKHIDERWPEFAQEARHLHLGLAMDGVNPFGQRSTTYSVWPVVVVNYNIPPWLTTKKGHLILSLLVPGRYKVKNMDVYLQPLVDELKELWSGIKVVDKSKRLDRQIVDIRGILMWTMHDYPGYGECSGLVTSGYHACAICGPGLNARYSSALKKMIYQGHRAYLPEAHPGREGFLGRRPLHMTAKDWQLMKQRHHEGLPPGMKRFSTAVSMRIL
ncbi:hypothetical protein L7F22_046745 [Adiantum nelumboides]|nr:hypothetical protein [Adiantum nelumboides]MCO5592742.1 hypothetical protein [Adiantum nelumboides]